MAKTTIKRKDIKEDDYDEFVEEKEEQNADNDLLPYADNSGNVPLFANSDGRSNRTISSLKLYKLEEKGYAYKGAIPLNSTKESIGEQFGDGVYNIEACNKKHKVLDIIENVRISLGHRLPAENTPKETVNGGISSFDLDRIERLATKSADESKEIAKQVVELVISTAKEQIAKEREYMAGVQKNMTDFMTGMSAMQAQGFQQTMTLLQTAHAHTLQQMNAGDKNSPKESMQLVETLIKGINLGKDMSGGEDDEMPFWQQILEGGIGLMSKAAQAKELMSRNNAPNQLAAPTMSPKELQKRKRALLEALQLRKAVRSSGLTTDEALRKLQSGAESPPPDEESEDEESDDESDDEDSFEDSESQESEGVSGTN